jgi:hypothetical protein
MQAVEPQNALLAECRKLIGAAMVFVAILAGWFAIQTLMARYAKLPDAQGGSCTLWFVGSSTMHKWASLRSDMSPWTAYNRGADGATIQAIAQMFANDTVRNPPHAIITYLGDNDIALGQRSSDVVEVLRTIISEKRKLYGETPLYVISIKPSPARFEFLLQQRKFNQQASAIAADYKDVDFIDVADKFLINGKPGDFYVPDGVHLNAAGYGILSRGVRTELAKERAGPAIHPCAASDNRPAALQ